MLGAVFDIAKGESYIKNGRIQYYKENPP